MGKQINFYMDIYTETVLIEQILEEGQILCRSDDNLVKIVSPQEVSSSNDYWRLYLYKPEFGELTLETLTNGKLYMDATRSPVIEFIRTIVRDDDKEVSRGRMWVKMKYWDSEGNLVDKPEELDKWYASLRRWIIKNLTVKYGDRSFTIYASESIRDLIHQGYHLA